MPITYEEILPWGRSYDEYLRMFGLGPPDLVKRILGCGDGPAAFNAAMTALGYRVTSVDPLYHFERERIAERIAEVTNVILEQTANNRHLFRWDNIRSVEELSQVRHAAMRVFLEDYDTGLMQGRYIAAELPKLPFGAKRFGLALSSHFLFLYSDKLDLEFHVKAIDEMLRVAEEVRIFPVVGLDAKPSRHLSSVMQRFEGRTRVSLVPVDYEFQIGAHHMLQIVGQPRR